MANTAIHMVPVPEDRLQEVYAVLGRASANGTDPPLVATPPPSWNDESPIDESLILRAYRESPPSVVKFVGYLADHPDETISSNVLAEHMGITWNQLAGVLGAFGRRWKNRYEQKGRWFFRADWNFEKNHMEYSMPAAVADIIKRARSGS